MTSVDTFTPASNGSSTALDRSSSSSASNAASAPTGVAPEVDLAQVKQKQQERALKTQRKKQEATQEKEKQAKMAKDEPLKFKPRDWLIIPGKAIAEGDRNKRIKLMSWNMLAQALVRRELFPGSDFLKIKSRVPTLMAEVIHYSPSIVCLQEVDHITAHLKVLDSNSYSSVYHIGYENKSHGLLISYKTKLFDKVVQKELRLDELYLLDSPTSEAQTPEEERVSRGLSRVTRNVALLIALKYRDGREGGLVIGTTHLFWHPRHVYERVRQTALLLKEAEKFRREVELKNGGKWECILAGDFNTQPNEITYALLQKSIITPSQLSDLTHSTVVHQSVDQIYDPSYTTPEAPIEAAEATEGSAESDPDKVIKNSRASTASDGLFKLSDFQTLYNSLPRIRSAYGEMHGVFPSEQANWYGERSPLVESGVGWKIAEDPSLLLERRNLSEEDKVRGGFYEPVYSNFTPLWRCTLDYIFCLARLEEVAEVGVEWTGLLKLHDVKTMGDGLPKMGVEPSDHIAIAAEIEIK